MARTQRAQLKAIVAELEQREKNGANPEALKVLYDILEAINQLDLRVQVVEKEVGPPESFIDGSDVPNRLRS